MGQRRLGLIVNPIAGIGGRVSLKGTDGAGTVERLLPAGMARSSRARHLPVLIGA